MDFPLSTSCSRCSTQKTKCSGKRIGCVRYQLYRTVRPRYSRPLTEQFRREDTIGGFYDPAVGVSRQFLPASNDSLLPADDLSSHPKVTRQPQPAFKDEAIAYFLQEYCIQPGPNGFGGHLDSLQYMYQSSPQDSCLRKTTIATACLCLSRHYKSPALYSMASAYYKTALRAVNRNLISTSNSVKDETLVSILFLGMIEDIDSRDFRDKSNHMLGIAKIYEVAGHRLLNNIHKRQLDGWIFSDLQIPSLNADEELDCLTIPDSGLDTDNFYIRLSLIATRVGHFYRRAKQFSSSGQSERRALQRNKLVSIIKHAMNIQSNLIEVAGSLPPQWKTWSREDSRLIDNKGSANTSRWISCLGCGFNMTLILFFHSFLSCCRTLVRADYRNKKPTPETHLAETSMPLAEAQLKRLITSICTIVPYVMGETDERGTPLTVLQQKAIVMYRLIWPLAIVVASPQSTRQQVQDCRERLDWIRDRYGIKLASAAVDIARDLIYQ